MGAFSDHVIQGLKGRWMMVVACFFILSFAGSNYIFGLYSQTIKINLGYDQEVIDTLAFFKDLGANVGIIAGLINEFCPPWVVLTIGSGMNLTGYLMIWLSVTGRVVKPAVWQMYMYQCIGGSSMTFVNTGILVTCVKNFPRRRGLVIGLLKGFVGLSGAIITQIYRAASKDEDPSFLIILAATLPTSVVLLLMPIIRPMEAPKEKNETKNFYIFLVMALVFAGLLMVFILLENLLVLPQIVIQLFAAVTLLIIFLPLLIVIRSELQKSDEVVQGDQFNDGFSDRGKSMLELQSSSCKDVNSVSVEISVLAKESKSAESSNELVVGAYDEKKFNKRKWPERGEDHTIPQALMSLDLWILFLAATCGLGSTITAMDNMGQIGKSLGYSSLSISTFVSLLSIWNFLGRVGAGFISEILLHMYSIPRPFLLSLVLLVASIGHLLIASALPGSLYMASILIGMCFGAQWPLMFSIISELFGLRHFAILFNIGASASPLGAYMFSVRVAGYFYDKQAKLEVPSAVASNEMLCVGKSCFGITFFIMAAISIVGSAIAAVLVYRTKQFYKQDIYKKFNEEADDSSLSKQKASCNGQTG